MSRSVPILFYLKSFVVQVFAAVPGGRARRAKARVDSMKLGGNVKGDIYQNGGCIIAEAGGKKTLLHYK